MLPEITIPPALQARYDRLDAHQKLAADEIIQGTHRTTVVLAGAGSGKSATLVPAAALAALLPTSPARGSVLATTFTKAGATVLEKRFREVGLGPGIVQASTFHSLAWRTLNNVEPLTLTRLPGRADDARKGDGRPTAASWGKDGPKVRRAPPWMQRVEFHVGTAAYDGAPLVKGISPSAVWRRLLISPPRGQADPDRAPAGFDYNTGTWTPFSFPRQITPESMQTPDGKVRAQRLLRSYKAATDWLLSTWGSEPFLDPTDLDYASAQADLAWIIEAHGFDQGDLFRRAFNLFLRVRRDLGIWDFDDLLATFWRRCVRTGQVGYKLVLVDEAQDNSPGQLRIAQRLAENAGGRLVLIGDVRQSIYYFRGAAPQIVEALANAPETQLVYLSNNYRSRGNIVLAGNAVAASEAWALGHPSTSTRAYDVPPTTAAEALGVVRRLTGGETVHDVAGATLGDITLRTDRGQSPGDFAILCRNNADADVFEVEAVLNGIPVLRIGGVGSLSSPLALSALAWFYVLSAPDALPDNLDWAAAAASSPVRSTGRSKAADPTLPTLGPLVGATWSLKAVARPVERTARSVVTTFFDNLEAGTRTAGAFESRCRVLRGAYHTVLTAMQEQEQVRRTEAEAAGAPYTPDHTDAERPLRAFGYTLQALFDSDLREDADADSEKVSGDTRIPGFATFADLAELRAEFMGYAPDGSVQDSYITDAAMITRLTTIFSRCESSADVRRVYDAQVVNIAGNGSDANEAAKIAEARKNRLTVSTIHRSKGLEWKIVYVLAPAAQFIPPDLAGAWVDAERGYAETVLESDKAAGARLEIPPEVPPSPRLVHLRAEAGELRRLLYVAVTRAEDECVLIGTSTGDYALCDWAQELLQPVIDRAEALDAMLTQDAVRRAFTNEAGALVFSEPPFDNQDGVLYRTGVVLPALFGTEVEGVIHESVTSAKSYGRTDFAKIARDLTDEQIILGSSVEARITATLPTLPDRPIPALNVPSVTVFRRLAGDESVAIPPGPGPAPGLDLGVGSASDLEKAWLAWATNATGGAVSHKAARDFLNAVVAPGTDPCEDLP